MTAGVYFKIVGGGALGRSIDETEWLQVGNC